MLRIIFVDDELDLLPLLKLCLSSELGSYPHLIETASSGEACLELLRAKPPETQTLVVSDINMPKMNGFELIETLKSQYPSMTFYVCTAYDTPEYEKRAKEVGALRFFTKPLDFQRLKETVVSDFPG